MKAQTTIKFDNQSFMIDLNQEIDISIPVRFDNQQFKSFGAPPASTAYYSGEDFTVSVEADAGCNCPVFNFSAHLHGTHTECVGHISEQEYIVQDVVGHPGLVPALLITVEPITAEGCGESYNPEFEEHDQVITRAMLEGVIHSASAKALIIRTLPNDECKKMQDYNQEPPAFFTNEAMTYIIEEGFEHLLVDIPSVDRLQDEGRLSNHHIFWGVEQGSHDVLDPSSKSITEFIYVPNEVADGVYMLDLNIGNIRSDAAPSRPVLYEVRST